MTRREDRQERRKNAANDEPHGSAGSIPAREQIESAIAWVARYVGENVPMTARWDRTGGQTFPLVGGDPKTWTTLNLLGQYGRFQFSADRPIGTLIDAAGVSYLVAADGRSVSIDPEPIKISLPENWLNTASASSGAAVGDAHPAGIDPLSLGLSIFSILRAIWGILHPTLDLMLGGNVAATAVLSNGELTITFSQCPSIRLIAYWTFELGVQSITLSPSHAHVEFVPQPENWIKVKSRDFEVT
jgi:hypothetical protein